MTNFTIIYSKRKTVSLEVTVKGDLIVRAPFFMNYNEIQHVVLRHRRWIINKLKYIRSLPYIPEKQFVSGEYFWYLGNTHKLNIVDKQKEKLTFKNGEFYLRSDVRNQAKSVFTNWYKEKTLKMVQEKANFYSTQCGASFKSVKVTSAEKRWGSCSGNNSINFSYRVAMIPIFAIDYIVVHELCHTLEHNHSQSFWNCVIGVIPYYKNAKEWLKRNGYKMHI